MDGIINVGIFLVGVIFGASFGVDFVTLESDTKIEPTLRITIDRNQPDTIYIYSLKQNKI